MDTAMETLPAERPGHRRNRSAVIKSILTPQSRKRSPSKTRGGSHPLGEIHNNSVSQSPSPMKGRDTRDEQREGLWKQAELGSPAKPRSSRHLPSKPLQQDSQDYFNLRDEKNNSPPISASTPLVTPIWAQFASQPLSSHPTLDDSSASRSKTSDEHKSGMERDHSPSKMTITKDSVQKRHKWSRSEPTESNPSKNANLNPIAAKRGSKVMAAVALFNGKPKEDHKQSIVPDVKDLDAEFEAVLISRNIPEKQRPAMRSLDARIKADFIKNDRIEIGKVESRKSVDIKRSSFRGRSRSKSRANSEETNVADDQQPPSPSKRSRSRSRTFNFSKGDVTPSKRQRSSSRPRSFMLHRNSSSTSLKSLSNDAVNDSKEKTSVVARPEDFVAYLEYTRTPQDVEIGKIHKLRLLLRNETVSWVDSFISGNGMAQLLGLLKRVMEVEWREEHEDMLLHEVLLCLKGLCTTELALESLANVASTLFPDLLKMLFDEERRGPSDFNTRGIIISLLFTHLSTADSVTQPARAKSILSYLSDPAPAEEAQALPFIQQMHQPRPYQLWRREIVNVVKEVFWIFLHHLNIISSPSPVLIDSVSSYSNRHFPSTRPPVPAAPYVGGVEWDATQYLSSHVDLLNGLVASLPTRTERNALRAELRASGVEGVMGQNLRTCKEKFYGCVHDGLRTWVGAAEEDGWEVKGVKEGPPREDESPRKESPVKCSPKKKKSGASGGDAPPKLELPVLGLGGAGGHGGKFEEIWL